MKKTLSLRNQYLPVIDLSIDDLVSSPLYQTSIVESDEKGDIFSLNMNGCRFKLVFRVNEIPDSDGGLGVAVDLLVEVPPEMIMVKVNYSIYLLSASYSTDSFDPKKRDVSTRGTRLINKSYNYDDGRSGQGSGPFYLPMYDSWHIAMSTIEEEYLGENNSFRLVVKLNQVDFYEDKNYLAKEVLLLMAPEQFNEVIANYQQHVARLQKDQEEQKKSTQVNQVLIRGIDDAMENDEKYNGVNRVNGIISEVNQRFRSNLRSNADRIEQLKVCLSDHNLNHFLKKMDLNQPQQIESDLTGLKNLSLDQLYDLFERMIDLNDEILERLEELKFCGVCYSAPKNVVLTPCGHMFFCNDCTTNFTSHHKLCPRCRQPYLGMETLEV